MALLRTIQLFGRDSCLTFTFPQTLPDDESRKKTRILITAADTLTWQLLASVLVPGFTINRLCMLSSLVLRRYTAMATGRRNWTTTAVGLASIPVIVSPIDRSVDWLMDKTVRKYYDNR